MAVRKAAKGTRVAMRKDTLKAKSEKVGTVGGRRAKTAPPAATRKLKRGNEGKEPTREKAEKSIKARVRTYRSDLEKGGPLGTKTKEKKTPSTGKKGRTPARG